MAHEILTISTDEKFAGSLRYVLRRLAGFIKSEKVSVRMLKKDKRTSLVVVLNDVSSVVTIKRLGNTIIDCLADVVVTDCKAYYIESSLKLPIDDEISRHAFIMALSNFDSDTDKTIARSLIRLTPNFLLDSFYQFMIDDLKVRWNEVCSLANENACYLACAGTFRELLRFLISNLESREREVHLFQRPDGMEFLTGGLKPINNIYINEDLPPDVQIVNKLISIAPKKIYLHCDNKDNNGDNDGNNGGKNCTRTSLVNYIQSLFSGCVQIVRN